jgi:hypothetical protein
LSIPLSSLRSLPWTADINVVNTVSGFAAEGMFKYLLFGVKETTDDGSEKRTVSLIVVRY